MTIEVRNPATGRLVVAGLHDGDCGVERDADGRATVAFRWGRGARRPEAAIGAAALLDGQPYRIAAARRSELTQGFYLALLIPAAPSAG